MSNQNRKFEIGCCAVTIKSTGQELDADPSVYLWGTTNKTRYLNSIVFYVNDDTPGVSIMMFENPVDASCKVPFSEIMHGSDGMRVNMDGLNCYTSVCSYGHPVRLVFLCCEAEGDKPVEVIKPHPSEWGSGIDSGKVCLTLDPLNSPWNFEGIMGEVVLAPGEVCVLKNAGLWSEVTFQAFVAPEAVDPA